MSRNTTHQQLFELWRQASLSALCVNPARFGMGDAVRPDVAQTFLDRARRSWGERHAVRD